MVAFSFGFGRGNATVVTLLLSLRGERCRGLLCWKGPPSFASPRRLEAVELERSHPQSKNISWVRCTHVCFVKESCSVSSYSRLVLLHCSFQWLMKFYLNTIWQSCSSLRRQLTTRWFLSRRLSLSLCSTAQCCTPLLTLPWREF